MRPNSLWVESDGFGWGLQLEGSFRRGSRGWREEASMKFYGVFSRGLDAEDVEILRWARYRGRHFCSMA